MNFQEFGPKYISIQKKPNKNLVLFQFQKIKNFGFFKKIFICRKAVFKPGFQIQLF